MIDRGIASGEFYECDSHVLALGYIGMTLGSYRWLRPHGRRTAQEIALEFSTALLRGLIRDEARAGGIAVGRRRWSADPANSKPKPVKPVVVTDAPVSPCSNRKHRPLRLAVGIFSKSRDRGCLLDVAQSRVPRFELTAVMGAPPMSLEIRGILLP